MEAELTGLERAVIACLLAPKHPVTDALRNQADRCRVAAREFTGVGFYTTLEVPSDAAPAAVRSGRMTLGDVTVTIDGLKRGAGFVLWIEDGVLQDLEAFTYEPQARILSRIVDEVDRHRRGEGTALQLFNNLWGLIAAAEVQGTPEGAEVEDLYLAATGADDLRHSWIPPEHRTTDSDVDAALERLRDWALAKRQADGYP